MNIVLSTAMFYPRSDEDWLKITEGLEFDGYEIMPQDWSECFPAYYKELLPRLGERKILSFHFPLVLMGFFQNPHPNALKTGQMLMDNLMESAVLVGAKDIVIHSTNSSLEMTQQATLENIKYFGDLAEKHSVFIGVENTKRSDCNTPDKLEEKIRLLNHPNIVPMIDVTEAMESGVDPIEFITRFPQVRHLHLSDHLDETPHVPFGMGTIDWKRLAEALQYINFQGNLVIELSYRHLLHQPISLLKESVSFVRDLIS